MSPGSARWLAAGTRESNSQEQGRSKAGSQTTVFNVMHGETARSTAKARFTLCAVYASLPFAVLGLWHMVFTPAQILVSLRVCPDPCVSRDTYALAYLSGSVTHPGAMLLPQSGGGGPGAVCSWGVQGHTSLVPKTWRVRAEPCPAAGTHGLIASRGDWQEGDRTLQQWQSLRESDLFFSLLSPTLNRFATISTAGTTSQPQILADKDLLS